MPMFSGMTFSMAIMLPGVTITLEINMADIKAEVVSYRQMLLTSQRYKTVIVCFRGCRRHI